MTDDLMKQIERQRQRREEAEDLHRYVLEEFGPPLPKWMWWLVGLYWIVFYGLIWWR